MPRQKRDPFLKAQTAKRFKMRKLRAANKGEAWAICTVDGCQRPTRARGLCTTHWARWRRNGKVELDASKGPRRKQRDPMVDNYALDRLNRQPTPRRLDESDADIAVYRAEKARAAPRLAKKRLALECIVQAADARLQAEQERAARGGRPRRGLSITVGRHASDARDELVDRWGRE